MQIRNLKEVSCTCAETIAGIEFSLSTWLHIVFIFSILFQQQKTSLKCIKREIIMFKGKKVINGVEMVLFSWLCLGAKFKYPNSNKMWVKISDDLNSGCVAEWSDDNQDTYWVGQSVCSFNDDCVDDFVILVK
jgi:hypothetical protein